MDGKRVGLLVVGWLPENYPPSPRVVSARNQQPRFTSGDPNKFDPRNNFRSGPSKSLLSTGTAVKKLDKKLKLKSAISTAKTGQTYLDVTGRPYEQPDLFVPQFDEARPAAMDCEPRLGSRSEI